MLSKVQRGLERLYRIETELQVDDFLVGPELRAKSGVARRPREQLLLAEHEDELSVGLFVDDEVLSNLEQDDPTSALHDGNLPDFLYVVEGVSHFVYLTWRAQKDEQVSALELELQAEIDKYVTCLLSFDSRKVPSRRLRHRLFSDFEFEPDLDAEERDRYRAANANASSYSRSLEERFVETRRIPSMLEELRHFYRLSLRGKLDHIREAA